MEKVRERRAKNSELVEKEGRGAAARSKVASSRLLYILLIRNTGPEAVVHGLCERKLMA